MAAAGTYTVTYNVSDGAGNAATQNTRTVVVEAAFDDTAELAVTGISMVANESGYIGTAVADDSYTNGWRWVFNVTVPTSETVLNMKFNDFVSGSDSIAATDNIRIYSAQSSNASDTGSSITITAADTFSSDMTLSTDLDAETAGRQIQVTVEVKVPTGSAGGSYSSGYGVQTDEE